MEKVDISEYKILHLTLKKRWYDMILSGQKKEEYREIKKYWDIRFKRYLEEKKKNQKMAIKFTNGYGEGRPCFYISLRGFTVGHGVSKWGAETGQEYHVLKLGKVLDSEQK